MAVSWTNLLQGTLMFLALAIVPTVAIADIGGFHDMAENLIAQEPDFFHFLGGMTEGKEIILSLSGGLGISCLLYTSRLYNRCRRRRICRGTD